MLIISLKCLLIAAAGVDVVLGVSDPLDAINAAVSAPGINYSRIPATHARGKDKPSKAISRVHAIRGNGRNVKSAAAVLGAHQRHVGGDGYQNVTSTTAYGTQYATEIFLNGWPTMCILDTGSADTWVVRQDYECVDYVEELLPSSACAFGPGYPDDFQYGAIPNEHLYIEYGDGEVVYGPVGYSDITVGGITVRKQEIGLANQTYWNGNNVTSGIFGLGYPSMTNAYYGDGKENGWINSVTYNPVFTNMIEQGLSEPYFSIAVSRNASDGMICFGGTCPVGGLDHRVTAETDILIANLIDNPFTSWDYSFYTIIPDGLQWDQTCDTRQYPYITDSGTTLFYLPPPLAQAINAAFDPPATYLWLYGAFFTKCTARTPNFSINISGVNFPINRRDMIYHNVVDPLTGLCMTAFADGGTGPYILGDVWFQNVLAIFDVGHAKMRFISRQFY